MQDSHIDSPNRPRAEHRADPSPVQLSIVPYPGLVRPKLYRVWLWAFPKVIRDVVLCSLQGKCALERSWLRTRVSRNLQPRQQQLFQKQVSPPRRRAEARSARLWPLCTRSFSSAITSCVEDWLEGTPCQLLYETQPHRAHPLSPQATARTGRGCCASAQRPVLMMAMFALRDRKSTRLNSSHGYISYAVFCLKKKKK